jgi:hypothetical protein
MKDYLIAARAKIADPTNWTQNAFARDVYGSEKPRNHPLAFNPHWEGIDGRDPRACQWCAMGAVQAVTPSYEPEALVFHALHKAAGRLYEREIGVFGGIAEVNDNLGHDAVLACFDKAIEDES